MRRFLVIALVLVLLLAVVGGVLLPRLLDKEKLLAFASETIKKETGATLTVAGDTRVSVFPTLGITLGDAALILPGKTEPDLTMGFLQLGVQVMPLLSGEIAVDTFSLDNLTARIESAPEDEKKADTSGLSDAQLDAFYEERRRAREQAGAAAGAEAALAVPLALNVNKLSISNARLELVDPTAPESTLVDVVKLEASNLNLDGARIPLQLTLRLPGEQTIDVIASGEFSVDQENQQAELHALDVTASGATAAPIELRLSGPVDLSRQAADLQLTLNIGATRGEGTMRYANFESPQIDASLSLNLFDPALFALAGPEAAEAAAEQPETGSGDAPLPLDALRAIDTQAQLRIDQVVFGVHTLEQAQAKVRVVDGIAQLQALSGTLHGGELQATATLNGKHNTARLVTEGSLAGLDLATALAAMESTAKLSGGASLSWRLNSSGRTSNELTAAMSGPVKLNTEQVVLAGTSVEHLLCRAVALTNKESLTATFPTETRFEALSVDIAMADGKARLQPLDARLQDIGLAGTGSLDLLSQDFSATFAARLSPGLEELDRACRVSKRLTAIDWPVKCSGNLADEPADWCGVDTEQILKDLAVSEGKRKLEKEAGKLFDKFLKKK